MNRSVWVSTILEFIYSCIYLFVVAYALQNANTYQLLFSYAGGCAFGTFLRMQYEKRKKMGGYLDILKGEDK